MKEKKETSSLWEKVAAGFLALFAIREGAKMVNAIITSVFLLVVFCCLMLYLITA